MTADFYTRFARPDNTLYSWNRSFSSDRDRFVSGDLALYFGYGSEGKELERLNPNLNFDIAEVPQGATAPEAGAAIHNDFKDKFIRAETVQWNTLLADGSWGAAREKGDIRTEGKTYVVQDGDVMVFLHS